MSFPAVPSRLLRVVSLRSLAAFAPVLAAASFAASFPGCSAAPAATAEGTAATAFAESAFDDAGPSCDFTSLAGEPSAPLAAGAYAVEGFRVAVDASLGLDVRHASEPGRVLASTPAGAGFLTASRAAVTTTERQGSFGLDETVTETCASPRVEGVVAKDGRLLVRGTFAGDGRASCSALGFEVRFCQARDHHLVFDATTSDASFGAVSVRFASDAGEHVWGMGEQFAHDKLDLKGRRIPVIVQEGGVGRGHVPITPAVNAASPGSGGSEDSTYYAAPHLLTSRARSYFLEGTDVAFFDMRSPDAIDMRVYAPRVRGRVLHGGSPLELIERFTEYAGRMPPLPDWTGDGAIVALARPLDRSRDLVKKLKDGGVAIAGVWNQTWSGKVKTYVGEQVLWNWVQDPNTVPGWPDYVKYLSDQGIRPLCYVNPMLRDVPPETGPVARNLFREASAGGFLVKDATGAPLLLPVTAFNVGLLDLSSEPARRFIKDVIKTEMIEKAGCRGWMADFGEALPFAGVLASGDPASRFHNQYPVEWARVNREAVEEAGMMGEVLVWNRSGHTQSPRYSMLVWEGDQLTTWDKYDGFVSALHGMLNAGFSGVSLVHSDTGGYTSLTALKLGYARERELLQRWVEMSAFTAVLRTHEGNQPDQNAQVYDDASIAHFARFSKVFRALKFYRAQLFTEAAQKGWPVVRHLGMHYPDDETAVTTDDELLLGSEILVAPVKNKCWTAPLCGYDKDVYLPRGRWVHLWSGKVYGAADRGAKVTVKAPIGQPAVFYKEGSPVGATLVANLNAAGIATR